MGSAGNWIQLLRRRTKGPLRAVGTAPRQRQLPQLFTAPQKPLEPRSGRSERSWHLPRKQPVRAATGGYRGHRPLLLGDSPREPQDLSLGVSPSGSILGVTVPWSPWGSTPLPGHSCPWPRDKTKVAFCGVGKAEDVAISDRAAGQPPAPRGLSPAALGAPRGVTSPAHGPGAVPASLCATEPQRCCCLQSGMGQEQQRSSQKCTKTRLVASKGTG